MTACGMPSVSSSQAVSLAPWSSGRVSSTQTCSTRPRSHAARMPPSAVPYPPVASPPVLQCVSTRAPALEQVGRMRGHQPAPLDLVGVEASARSGVGSSRIASSAQRRLTAVGRDAASARRRASRSSPRSAASASPYAAATPIAGAPRTASVRIASATSAADSQRSSTSSSGRRRWSRTTTASCSRRTMRRARAPACEGETVASRRWKRPYSHPRRRAQRTRNRAQELEDPDQRREETEGSTPASARRPGSGAATVTIAPTSASTRADGRNTDPRPPKWKAPDVRPGHRPEGAPSRSTVAPSRRAP